MMLDRNLLRQTKMTPEAQIYSAGLMESNMDEALGRVEHALPQTNIRRMEKRDLPAVKAMCQRLVAHVVSCGQDAAFEWDERRLVADMFADRPWLWGFVAEVNGVVHGYTIAAMGYELDRWRREFEVLDLYLDEEARGLGLARSLLAANATLGEELGCDQLRGLVYKDNDNMLRIFRRMGADLQDYHVLYRVQIKTVKDAA